MLVTKALRLRRSKTDCRMSWRLHWPQPQGERHEHVVCHLYYLNFFFVLFLLFWLPRSWQVVPRCVTKYALLDIIAPFHTFSFTKQNKSQWYTNSHFEDKRPPTLFSAAVSWFAATEAVVVGVSWLNKLAHMLLQFSPGWLSRETLESYFQLRTLRWCQTP